MTIKSERELARKIEKLRRYAGYCVAKAKRSGLEIRPGWWLEVGDWGNHCCVVGAIGCANVKAGGAVGLARFFDALPRSRRSRSSQRGTRISNVPAIVTPLIRNGATALIDEPTLWALSDGFEQEKGPSTRPRGATLDAKYRQAAYDLGRELYEKHCTPPAAGGE